MQPPDTFCIESPRTERRAAVIASVMTFWIMGIMTCHILDRSVEAQSEFPAEVMRVIEAGICKYHHIHGCDVRHVVTFDVDIPHSD